MLIALVNVVPRLESLEFVVVEKDARLVIVDSIASVAVYLSGSSVGVRASQLSSWAATLKALAHQLNICVSLSVFYLFIHFHFACFTSLYE